jgi:hypothetical protein
MMALRDHSPRDRLGLCHVHGGADAFQRALAVPLGLFAGVELDDLHGVDVRSPFPSRRPGLPGGLGTGSAL